MDGEGRLFAGDLKIETGGGLGAVQKRDVALQCFGFKPVSPYDDMIGSAISFFVARTQDRVVDLQKIGFVEQPRHVEDITRTAEDKDFLEFRYESLQETLAP